MLLELLKVFSAEQTRVCAKRQRCFLGSGHSRDPGAFCPSPALAYKPSHPVLGHWLLPETAPPWVKTFTRLKNQHACPFLIRDSRKSWHGKCIINTVRQRGNKDLISSEAEGKKAALLNYVSLAFQEAQLPLPPEQATFCPHTTFKMLLRPGYFCDHYTTTTLSYSKGHRHKIFISAWKWSCKKVKPALTISKLQCASSAIPTVLL